MIIQREAVRDGLCPHCGGPPTYEPATIEGGDEPWLQRELPASWGCEECGIDVPREEPDPDEYNPDDDPGYGEYHA